MKGISAVLATVLIVVITVAIIGLSYGWATGLFGTVTEASEEGTENVVSNLQKTIDITSATCGNEDITTMNYLTFTLRNTGSADIETGELSAFVDEISIDTDWTNVSDAVQDVALEAGTSEEFKYNLGYATSGELDEREVVLKVVSPAGLTDETLTCPAIVSGGGIS